MRVGDDLTLVKLVMGISSDAVRASKSNTDSPASRFTRMIRLLRRRLNLMQNQQFSIQLSEQDWDATHREWQCEALRVATLVRVVVAGERIPTEVHGQNIKPLVTPDTTAARVELELNMPSSVTSDGTRPWKVLTGLLVAVVPLAIAWVNTQANVEIERTKSEAEAARARAEAAKSAAESAKASAESDKARAESANRACSKEADKLKAINTCYASGGSRANCNDSTFNILGQR